MQPSVTPESSNPAIEQFIASFENERQWAQLLITKAGSDFRLRHIADRNTDECELRQMPLAQLRQLSMFSANGQFRPLRSAPDLVSGWISICHGSGELWRALQDVYPGSIGDWFAARSEPFPVTGYRDFTNRQTGMYRITQLLTDEQAARVTAAACHRRFCLKRRLWPVARLESDRAAEKSEIPCLEPCAILLELARKAARIEQEALADVQISAGELDSMLAAAEFAIENAAATGRIGNITSPLNPRRLQLMLEKYKGKQRPSPSED